MPFVVGRLGGFPLGLLVACTPALNWREVAIPEMAAVALFPCKPQRHVNGTTGLVHCEADGLRFVMGWRLSLSTEAAGTEEKLAVQVLANRMNASMQRLQFASSQRIAEQLGGKVGYQLTTPEGSAAWVRVWVQDRLLHQALVVGSDQLAHQEAAEAFLGSIRMGAVRR